MKKLLLIMMAAFGAAAASAQDSPLEAYLPVKNVKFDSQVPTPGSVLGCEVGVNYADWNCVLRYMEALERASDRVSVKTFGSTFEHRPFIQVRITSPENQSRLESIRHEHLRITDPSVSSSLNLERMPLVLDVRSSIHGNEASGVNALLVVAYYFAASQDEKVKDFLDNTVLLLTPGQNPDGINKFASWVNTTVSEHPVMDINSLEHHEQGTPSRGNHYWNDCNRDWLNIQFPEGRNAVEMYLEWMPNVVLDLHEMNSASKRALYYFSPGDPGRTYHYIPQLNQDLTREISTATAAALDSLKVPYFTGSGFDDYFVGKGACYGDIQGSVCFLHEQCATRAHVHMTSKWGPQTWAQTIRNQSIATVTLAYRSLELKSKLMEYQRNFFKDEAADAAADAKRGYVFNARGNRGIAHHFIETLLGHGIEVYENAAEPGSYVVPFNGRFYYKTKSIFEDITTFRDSTFYDISTWTMSRAYNLDFAEVAELPALGSRVEKAVFPTGRVIGNTSGTGYAFTASEYYVPRMMAALQRADVRLTVATDSFEYKNARENVKKTVFPAGTIVVAAEGQTVSADSLYSLVKEQAEKCGVDVYALNPSSKLRGFDISSVKRIGVRNPKTLIVTGTGAKGGYQKLGEVWYLLDHRYNMDHTVADFEDWMIYSSSSLKEYNNVVIYGEMPEPSDRTRRFYKDFEKWISDGGTAIVFENGYNVLSHIGMPEIKKSRNNDKHVKGVILNASYDAACPLFWGYDGDAVPVFKMRDATYSLPEEATVAMKFTDKPYISGYVTEKSLNRYGGAPVVAVIPHGNGRVVFIAEDINFRSYWFGTSHILTNALYFGDHLKQF